MRDAGLGNLLGRFGLPLALAVVAACGVLLWDAPFLSEDHTHLAAARRAGSIVAAFDLGREPLRPLQHLFFHVLALWDAPVPGAARLASLVLHAGSVVLVFALARELALPRASAGGAALLFALYPNVKGIAWSAAISTPGRAAFVLAGLLFFLRAQRTDAPRDRMLFALAFVLALAFHEGAIVLPAACLAWVALRPGAGAVSGVRAALRALRDPALLAVAVATVLYVLYVAFLREERHHGLKSLDALPANVVKASLVLAPELPRTGFVGFLRTHTGAVGLAAGAGWCLLLALAALAVLRRGSHVARFAVAAIVLDLVLPTLGAGFVQRYGYLAAAWAALGVAAWAGAEGRARPKLALGLAVSLGAWWGIDTARDLGEYAAAGRRAAAILDAACAARAAEPERTIVVLDADDVAGAEHDIPVFNWGLPEALGQRDCAGPWLFWRTREFRTGTHVERVDPARVAAEQRRGELLVLRP